jgi:DNA invertase Pin-like site-specific DNA recombinase
MQRAIAYFRVSTQRQERSGLGLEAQQQAVYAFAKANHFDLINEYIEVNSGTRNHKYNLKVVLAECRRHRAVLVIAKLDRLSRNVAFISTLMEADVAFKIVDNPHAEEFVLHVLAAVAQKERKDISKRTSAALASAKQRGVELGKHGRYVLSRQNQFRAEMFAFAMTGVIEELKSKGIQSIRAITNELNRKNIPSYRNQKWHRNTVHQLIKRINEQSDIK